DDREHRTANRASLVAELDDVADDLAVLAAGPRRLVLGLELLSGGGTDDDRVVPRELGDRLRQLLQPAVVGEAAVEHARVEGEGPLEAARRGARRALAHVVRSRRRERTVRGDVPRPVRSVRDDAV